MPLNSLIFLFLFLPVILFLSVICPTRFRNLFLLTASVAFYAWGGVTYASVLLSSTLLNYLAGLAIGKAGNTPARKVWLIAGILVNVIPLAVFKYTGFFMENLNLLVGGAGGALLPVPRILLPLGISFYTFRAITYLVSVYRKETPVQRKYSDLALYISFFPSLMAGPIDRYRTFLPQIEKRTITVDRVASGIRRFALGLAKKVLIANTLAVIADELFDGPFSTLSTPLAWLGVTCYALQIYYDFSGYTDMAIGVGRMVGFTLTENFNFPYLSKSVKEFWQRWHISLSTWLRDYIFLPLAYSTSRKLKQERYFNLRTDLVIYVAATTVTFLACGAWHGAAWNFITWGLLHGLLLILEQAGLLRFMKRFPGPVRRLYAILALLVTWVVFRTNTLSDAIHYTGIMFGSGVTVDWGDVAGYFSPGLLSTLLIAMLGATTLFQRVSVWLKGSGGSSHKMQGVIAVNLYETASMMAVIMMLAASVVLMAAGTNNAFIYFRF